jgi:chromosome segregation ATPase
MIFAMSLDQQFNTINDKLQQLLKQYHRLQKENERLKGELQQHGRKDAEAQLRIEALQQQIGILKLSSGEMVEKDKKEFEKKINGYLREIDKCISFLSQ